MLVNTSVVLIRRSRHQVKGRRRRDLLRRRIRHFYFWDNVWYYVLFVRIGTVCEHGTCSTTLVRHFHFNVTLHGSEHVRVVRIQLLNTARDILPEAVRLEEYVVLIRSVHCPHADVARPRRIEEVVQLGGGFSPRFVLYVRPGVLVQAVEILPAEYRLQI